MTVILRGVITKTEIVPPELVAYGPGRSGAETTRSLMDNKEAANHLNEDIYIVVADLTAAFDKVKRSYILSALKVLNIPENITQMISKILSNNQVEITLNKAKIRMFKHG